MAIARIAARKRFVSPPLPGIEPETVTRPDGIGKVDLTSSTGRVLDRRVRRPHTVPFDAEPDARIHIR
jgi:hypothetical protein